MYHGQPYASKQEYRDGRAVAYSMAWHGTVRNHGNAEKALNPCRFSVSMAFVSEFRPDPKKADEDELAQTTYGGVAEWFKAAVLKTAVARKGTVSSNLTSSASKQNRSSLLRICFVLTEGRFDEKAARDAEPAGEALRRGRGKLRATASRLSVTESHLPKHPAAKHFYPTPPSRLSIYIPFHLGPAYLSKD